MAPFPAEKFMQVLAKYAKENSDISVVKKYFKERIDLRMRTKKTKKNPHLMLRNITDEAVTEKRKQKGKNVQSLEGPGEEGQKENDKEQGDAGSGTGSGTGSEAGKAVTQASKVAATNEGSLKRRRPDLGEKKKKYRLGFTAENLDIEERVAELKRAGVSEEEKDKAWKIEDTTNTLFGEREKGDTNLELKFLQDFLDAIRLEPIVINDSE